MHLESFTYANYREAMLAEHNVRKLGEPCHLACHDGIYILTVAWSGRFDELTDDDYNAAQIKWAPPTVETLDPATIPF